MGFHAFTDCKQTGKFNDHAKQSCWNTFVTSPKKVIDAFILLGNSIKHPAEECIDVIIIFVLNLYCKNRPTDIDNLSKLRLHMFSKKQLESDKLPPTFSALNYMIYRSHYMTYIWKSAISTNPILPDFGWKKIDDECETFMTDRLPTPQSVIELSMCSCKKTNCDFCNCKKKGLECSVMCQV